MSELKTDLEIIRAAFDSVGVDYKFVPSQAIERHGKTFHTPHWIGLFDEEEFALSLTFDQEGKYLKPSDDDEEEAEDE